MWIKIKRLVSTKRDIKENTRYTDPIRSQANTGSNAVEIRHSHLRGRWCWYKKYHNKKSNKKNPCSFLFRQTISFKKTCVILLAFQQSLKAQ